MRPCELRAQVAHLLAEVREWLLLDLAAEPREMRPCETDPQAVHLLVAARKWPLDDLTAEPREMLPREWVAAPRERPLPDGLQTAGAAHKRSVAQSVSRLFFIG